MTKCIYCIICYASGTRLGLFPRFVLFLLPPFCFVFSPFCVTAMLCILSNLESLEFWRCVWGRSLLKEKTSPPFLFHRGLGIARRKVKHPTLGGFQRQHGISFWGAPDLPKDSIGLPPHPAWSCLLLQVPPSLEPRKEIMGWLYLEGRDFAVLLIQGLSPGVRMDAST